MIPHALQEVGGLAKALGLGVVLNQTVPPSPPPDVGIMPEQSDSTAGRVVGIAKELRQAGVDGLYIDQLASYFPQPCFSRAGGDAAGTGWADGGRKLFSDVAQALGPDTAVFSESNAEAYIGDLHGNMALYGWERCGFVPAFQVKVV